MNQTMKDHLTHSIRDFSLPRYYDIPNVGLYLEQTSKYISERLSCLGEFSLTGSMISNYVKKGLIANPVKKQYSREQIAYLFFITAAKSVLSMEDIRLLVELQRGSYTPQKAYDYFCNELENVIFYVFGLKDTLDTVGSDHTDEKEILRNTIIAIAHKAYIRNYFAMLHSGKTE